MSAVLEATPRALVEALQRQLEEPRVVQHGITWEAYRAIGDALLDRSSLRMTYDRGTLEIMTTSARHEKLKERIGSLILCLAEELELEIEPGGSMTFQREDLERGLEPDLCFWIQNEALVRNNLEYDPRTDPAPDLVVEVEVSRSAVDRMSIFAVLKVPEVWRVREGQVRVFRLTSVGEYEPSESSPTFPAINMAELTGFFLEPQGHVARLRAFRAWLRAQRDT